MKHKKEESAVILTIKDAPDMTAKGRRQIAAWLRRQAGFLEKHAKELAPRYTARYLYPA
jgi:hypothetical protein